MKTEQKIENVIFYGAGIEADKYLSKSNKLYEPFVFCVTTLENNEIKKNGCDVITVDEAIRLYPESKIFICANQHNSMKMLRTLKEKGVSLDKIINREYRKGCTYLSEESRATFGGVYTKVVSECGGELKFKRLESLLDDLAKIENIRSEYRKKALAFDEIGYCDECFVQCADVYKKRNNDYKLNVVFESNYKDTVCNARCCYCTAYDKRRYDTNFEELESGRAFLEDWTELYNAYKEERIHVSFANGEMTASPWRKQVWQDLEKCNWNILVPTNGIIFDENLAQLIYEGRANTYIDFDAGTKNTFKTIRGVDAFEKVIDNVNRYIDRSGDYKNNISVKYLFLEGKNDSEEELSAFIEIAKEIGAIVIISNDNFTLPNRMTENLMQTMRNFIIDCDNNNLRIGIGRHCFNAEDYSDLMNLICENCKNQ
jgi:pyruvate-formate lyase-activating enzyme